MNDNLFCTTVEGMLESDAANQDTACLIRIYPAEGAIGLWRLDEQQWILGRDQSCCIQLHDDSVSRQHAVIMRTKQGLFIQDMGSTNGTFVNEERVTQKRLTAGDRIRIGNHIFKFLAADKIEIQYHETLYKMITTDGLTNAYNKQYLMELLDRETSRSNRYQRPLSLLMMDLDHFKNVNDTHGHLAGDHVLQEFSRRIHELIESDDILARFGGEEFALVMSESSKQKAREIAEAIRESISSVPFETSAGAIEITVSIGCATMCGSGWGSEELVQRADEMLYSAKRSGRDQVQD